MRVKKCSAEEEPTFPVSSQMTVGLKVRCGGIGFYEVSETESEKQSVYVLSAHVVCVCVCLMTGAGGGTDRSSSTHTAALSPFV